MEYCALTKSLRCPQFEEELKFEIAPIPSTFRDKYVQDGYASSSEYGLMTHDDDNALGHAFMILDRLRHKNSLSNRRLCRVLLIDDLQNLLHCYSCGLTVHREETEALVSSMLAVKGCARPLANSILPYYESYRKDITEDHYINYHNEYYAWMAWQKILCKRYSTKSRMALWKQSKLGTEALPHYLSRRTGRYARRLRRECRPGRRDMLREGISQQPDLRT